MQGIYYDGNTSRGLKAHLEVLNTDSHFCIHIEREDASFEQIALNYPDLNIESRLGDTPREISFGKGQLFITEDSDAVDEMIMGYGGTSSHSLLHRFESHLPLIVFSTVITIALIWSGVTVGIPKAAEAIAYQMPNFSTKQFGSTLDLLDRTLFDPSKLNAIRQQEIRRLAAPYFESFKHLNPVMEFRSGMGANALALPGGEIVFTDELVKLTENDEQLLAVLFHELGHLKYRHLIRRALQDSMVTILVILVTGDIDTIDLLTGLPTLILDLSYSREFEREADSFALKQMNNFEIPLEQFSRIMQSLEDSYTKRGIGEDDSEESLDASERGSEPKSSFFDFLSTHPPTEDRIQLVEQFKLEYPTK